jgi:steroid delta-isomerase-like uncharacterized protein
MKYKRHAVVLIGIFLLAATACNTQCRDLERNKEVVRKVAAAILANDHDALDQYIAEDYKRHCQATPNAEVNSLEDFKDLMRLYQDAFPDAEMPIQFLVAEDDLVAVWGTYEGTHTGPMGEIPATGKRVSSDFGGIHRLEDGKIVETWVTWDNVTMLQQLGLFPAKVLQAADESKATR